MMRTPQFSTQWKKFSGFFHTMEKLFPQCGKIGLGALAAIWLAGAGAGCQGLKASRLAVPKVVHWTATASASAEGFGPELALDGQTNTWWRSGDEEPQWIQVDMGRMAMVCGFSVQWGSPHATSYSVLTSRDGTHWAMEYETTGGDGDWDQASIEPILARYLRVVVDQGVQGTGAALCVLEIKGLADQPLLWVNGVLDPAAAMLDGNPATVWCSVRPQALVEVDLRTVKPIGSVRVDWGTNGFASNVVVEVSTNRTDWVSAGRIQSRSGDFDVLMNDEVRLARHVRFSFSGGSAENGFEVAGITLRGAEGAALPWAKYELAASHAPEGVYPDVFRRRQNYWAVASGPAAGDPESLLDEWGVFAPAVRAPTLAPLIVSEGAVLSARQAAAVEHRLGGDGAPMPETTWKMASGLALRIRALARPGAAPTARWLQYELANESLMVQTGRLCWVVRPVRLPPPWAGGGLAPIHKIRRVEAGGGWQEIRANDEPLFAVPATNLPFGAASFDEGDVAESFLRGETPAALSALDGEGLASAAWWKDFALEPGERMRLVVGVPGGRRFSWPRAESGADKVADAFDREWEEVAWAWRAETSRYAPKIGRPDAVECLHAQVGWLLGVRSLAAGGEGEEMDSIQARVAALLRAGQADAARTWIERVSAGVQSNGWVPAAFHPDGTPVSRLGHEGRHGSQGQFAFMVMEYYRFTQDATFLHEQYPVLRRTLAYLQGLRTDLEKSEWRLPEEVRLLLEGLLPLSGARLGSPRPVHLYADHYWALLAWKEGRTAASLLGMDQDATWADEHYRLLRSSVRRSLRERMDQMEASWIPASAEEDRFDAASVALLFWPCEETDLVEPHELQSSLDAFYEQFLLRSRPGWAGLIPSDEALMLTPLASMGRGDYAREVLWAQLDRRQPKGWQVWAAAAGSDPRQPGQIGSMPDIRASAAYLTAVRGLAARENHQRLDLFSGAPSEWLQHGEGYRVYGMPTEFGPLDLSGYWNKNRFVVEIGGGVRPPEGFRIWWPLQIEPERVVANGESLKTFDAQGATLPHDFKGAVEVFFPAHAPWPREP
jgi:hypothetical protein